MSKVSNVSQMREAKKGPLDLATKPLVIQSATASLAVVLSPIADSSKIRRKIWLTLGFAVGI